MLKALLRVFMQNALQHTASGNLYKVDPLYDRSLYRMVMVSIFTYKKLPEIVRDVEFYYGMVRATTSRLINDEPLRRSTDIKLNLGTPMTRDIAIKIALHHCHSLWVTVYGEEPPTIQGFYGRIKKDLEAMKQEAA